MIENIKIEIKDNKAKAFESLEDACKYLKSLKKKEQNNLTILHFG